MTLDAGIPLGINSNKMNNRQSFLILFSIIWGCNYLNNLANLPLFLMVNWLLLFLYKLFSKTLLLNRLYFYLYLSYFVFFSIAIFVNSSILSNLINLFIFIAYFHLFSCNTNEKDIKKRRSNVSVLLSGLYVFANIFDFVNSGGKIHGVMHSSSASAISSFVLILFLIFEVKNDKKVFFGGKLTLCFFITILLIHIGVLQSRSVWIGATASGLFLLNKYFYVTKQRIIITISCMFFVVLGITIYTLHEKHKFDSLISRYYIYKRSIDCNQGLDILKGNGIGTFTQRYFEQTISDNERTDDISRLLTAKAYLNSPLCEYLMVYVEYGLFGIFILIGIVYCVFKKYLLWKNNLDKDYSAEFELKISILVFFLSISFFNFGFYQSSYIPIFAYSISGLYLEDSPVLSTTQKIKNYKAVLLCLLLSSNLILIKTVELSKISISKSLSENSSIDMFFLQNSYRLRSEYIARLYKHWNYKQIVCFYEKLDNKAFQNPRIYQVIASSYEKMMNIEQAENLLLIAVNMEPAKFEPKLVLLKFYLYHEMREKAICLQKFVKTFPVKINNPKSINLKRKIVLFEIK